MFPIRGIPTSELKEALARHGAPEIYNTGRGCQFTNQALTDTLETNGMTISMDGKGAYRDNIFMGRHWRSMKYERDFLKTFKKGASCNRS